MRSVAVFAHDLAVLQAPGLATKVLQHAKRLNVDLEATSPLLDAQARAGLADGRRPLRRQLARRH